MTAILTAAKDKIAMILVMMRNGMHHKVYYLNKIHRQPV